MPNYYCEYCDIFLTHDSRSVRRSHNEGWKHKLAVEYYYSQFFPDPNVKATANFPVQPLGYKEQAQAHFDRERGRTTRGGFGARGGGFPPPYGGRPPYPQPFNPPPQNYMQPPPQYPPPPQQQYGSYGGGGNDQYRRYSSPNIRTGTNQYHPSPTGNQSNQDSGRYLPQSQNQYNQENRGQYGQQQQQQQQYGW